MRLRLEAVEREQIVKLAQETIFSQDGLEAFNWINKIRRIKKSIIEKFEIGYVPSFVKNFKGERHELAGRIVFPIRSNSNNLIAVSSRDFKQANSKEYNRGFWHESFDKSLYLYGINQAKEFILKYNKAIVVEGEIDTMALWSKGINCSVGILGSSIGVYQLSVLARYCNEIFIVADSDIAGQSLLDRIRKICNEKHIDLFGINIFLVKMPSPEVLNSSESKIDPDWFLKNRNVQEFIDILAEVKNNNLIGI
jgi:DNA primase